MNEVNVNNGKFSKKQMIDIFECFLLASNIVIFKKENKFNNFIEYDIEIDGRVLTLNVFLKNITNSGWAEKITKKRIQVPGKDLQNLIPNSKEYINLLIGICLVNNEPIFVVWNPFNFQFHKTNRSCYTNVYDIAKTSFLGFHIGIEAKKKLYYCDKINFKKLLKTYIEKNSRETI